MSNAKLEKQQKNLVEGGLMAETDTLLDYLQASYAEQLAGKLGKWKQGWAYFTEQRLIVLTGLLEDNIVIPYSGIQKLSKCTQSLLPIGIEVTYADLSGKTRTSRLSMMKRDKWIAFLSEKSGAAIG